MVRKKYSPRRRRNKPTLLICFMYLKWMLIWSNLSRTANSPLKLFPPMALKGLNQLPGQDRLSWHWWIQLLKKWLLVSPRSVRNYLSQQKCTQYWKNHWIFNCRTLQLGKRKGRRFIKNSALICIWQRFPNYPPPSTFDKYLNSSDDENNIFN